MALKPLDKLPQTPLKIRRALLSVSDKSGLVPFAETLHKQGVDLISTGGTATVLREAGLNVIDISEVTGFPECLDGRVKTLHPSVHGALLARTSHSPDVEEIKRLGIEPIELVVVNLYPFKETVKDPSVTQEIATENIDIGGPTMIRAAAKNFAHVAVVSSPAQYEDLSLEIERSGSITFSKRRKLARDAFRHTADYDTAISNYYSFLTEEELPKQWNVSLKQSGKLRYGENPHQSAGVYGDQNEWFTSFHGKELSFNNYLDIDAALHLMGDFKDADPAVAIFKHTVPCGVAVDGHSLSKAWDKAFATDKVSPFGGIVITNRELDLETAQKIDDIFTEIILAPAFTREAREMLQKKKNRRLIQVHRYPSGDGIQFRSIAGGALLQKMDTAQGGLSSFKTVTRREAEPEEIRDLLFAWKVVRHVKSNAIVYAGEERTLGIGTGQTSRVDSSDTAIRKASKEGLNLKGSVLASDAFFPFADSLEAAADVGVRAVIQPGGSIRDQEVIDAADKHGMAMILTGHRHFRH